MPVLELYGQAHVAPFAVEETVPAADPADAAAAAVVLVLVLVVEQVALQARVLQHKRLFGQRVRSRDFVLFERRKKKSATKGKKGKTGCLTKCLDCGSVAVRGNVSNY